MSKENCKNAEIRPGKLMRSLTPQSPAGEQYDFVGHRFCSSVRRSDGPTVRTQFVRSDWRLNWIIITCL